MLTLPQLGWFALAAFVLVLTPGPNMIYCISRTLCQGRAAGMLSLIGVLLGFVAHAMAAAFGLTALLMAVPFAFGVIKMVGAAYLLWMAWQAVRPGGASPFQARELPIDPPAKLFRMGFLTNVLNPKVAMFYLSFLPQFLHPEQGSVLLQSLELGAVQIVVSGTVNSLLILGAATISSFLTRSRGWMLAQRYLMGGVLAALAARIALSDR
ncbi:LysE family translocator [Ramlibacter sp.]|uniref:LysE family translocator n=1 Tax=Ramlibacter sp. TaxID=1917967 RepID=UPI0017BF9576|nr:LysE family translocator [Ramlibacter sp.]MBA2672208.1 LysE family translocator [Ramlibacter sp.]